MTIPTTTPVTATGLPSSLRRMCWIFPDRESTRMRAIWQGAFWNDYAEAAADLGLEWSVHPPDAISVDAREPGRPRVFLDGELVTPEDTLFLTALYSLPYQTMDIQNQYSIYAVLEQAGFYLPLPPWLSPIANDKLAAVLRYADSPVPPIPTIRVAASRDVGMNLYDGAIADLEYPVVVKPTGWASGRGVCLARDLIELRALLSLAEGGDTTIAIQPYLGAGTTDYGVFIIEGKPHTVVRRTPGKGAVSPRAGTGGTSDFVPLPDELAEAAAYFATQVPIPYFRADFLYDGSRFWFSEIEPDGCIIAPDDSPAAVQQARSVVTERWAAYRRGHAQWLEDAIALAGDTVDAQLV